MSPSLELSSAALAWLLTYLVHSTVFLGGALLAGPLIRRLAVRWQDRIWKVALLGGILTATAQAGSGLEPLGGRIALSPPPARTEVAAARAVPRLAPPPQGAVPEAPAGFVGPEAPLVRRPAAAGPRVEEPELKETRQAPSAAFADSRAKPWIPWLGATWGLIAALGVLAYVRAHGRLRRHLAGRVRLSGGPLRERLDALMERAHVAGNVRLSVSPTIAAPLTHGLLRREICVPIRALTDLHPHQQEALLGHELGHAIRRDPAWLGFCWLLERVLFLQPLNRVVRQRLQSGAELLCDDWAVHLTGRRLSLASCLTEVAQWVVGRSPALPAPSMAGSGAALTRRVERLLAAPPREVTRREPWWIGLGLAAVGGVALGAPGFAAARAQTAAARTDAAQATPPAPMAAAETIEASAAANAPPTLPAALRQLLTELDQELVLAGAELRELRREAHALGADECLTDELESIEAGMRLLAARRAEIRDLLPRALEVLDAAESNAPFPTQPSLPLRNPVR